MANSPETRVTSGEIPVKKSAVPRGGERRSDGPQALMAGISQALLAGVSQALLACAIT